MKIVVLSGSISSSTFCPKHDDGHRYLGGPKLREQLADADVVLTVWPPNLGAVVINRAPEGTEVQGVAFPHMLDPALRPGFTEDEWYHGYEEYRKATLFNDDALRELRLDRD